MSLGRYHIIVSVIKIYKFYLFFQFISIVIYWILLLSKYTKKNNDKTGGL
jgi:hypothetical protein